jgi:hypothetical protein
MWHATWTQGDQGDSRLLLVESQIGNLISDPSFGHNLCFRYLNGSCKHILDIHVPRAFQWYKELFNPMSFDPSNHSMKIQESIGTSTPKMGAHLGVWGFIPSHSLTLPRAWNVTPELILGPHICKPLLSHQPKVRIATKWHLGASPIVKHKVYYKGEGGGFPQVRVVVSLMSPCLPHGLSVH